MNTVNIGYFPTLGYVCGEAVNTLCTNISLASNDARKIMITSHHSSEGKSFIAMNIARTLAQLGKTVVFVDADLRRSQINSQYNLKFDKSHPMGLAHYLAGKADEEDVIYKSNIEGVSVVPVGRLGFNSLSMLSSMRLKQLLDGLMQVADYVIIDTPPLGEIIDAAEIAKSCDGALVVVHYDKVHHRELINLKEQLDQTGCPILGVVLNQVEFDGYMNKKYYYKSYGYYSYGYGEYGHKSSKKSSAAKNPARKKKKID